MKKERNEFRKMKILNKRKKERKIFICINLKQNTVSKIHLCSYYLNMKTYVLFAISSNITSTYAYFGGLIN